MKQYAVYITSRKGIFDPAGATAQHALSNLGFTAVKDVKIGKFIELTCDDDATPEAVAEMCDKLLANPIIEDYRIEACGQAGPSPSEQGESQVTEGA
jgi:phosphoribosylformylglycinamidine synthase